MKINKLTLTLSILSLGFVFFSRANDALDPDFYDDLKKELTDIISEKFWAKEQAEKYSKHIEKTTKRAIRRNVFNEAKNHVKNRVYNKNEPLLFEGLQDKVFIYKVPELPFYSQPFIQKDIFQVDMSFDWVDNSFYSGGESQDLSNLLFRQNDLTLKDILLVSRMTKEKKVIPIVNVPQGQQQNVDYNPVHYFYILADQPLIFDASYNRQRVDLNFSHHFREGTFSVGFQLPIIRQENEIRLISDISSEYRETLRQAHSDPTVICPNIPAGAAGPNFFEKYGTLENFLIDILDKKGISFNKKDSVVGFGNLSLFFNLELEWKEAERVCVGLNVITPMAKSRDTSKLWDPEVGNGGFYYIEPFASVLFSENRWFNPHVFLSLTVGLPLRVKRRVPKLISYDGIDPASGHKATDLMVYGNEVFVRGAQGIFTDEPDAKARRFGAISQKVSIIPGPKIFFRIGNICERFLGRRAFFDYYYDFGVKCKDYTRGSLNSKEYQQSVLTDNSWYFDHRIGGSYVYQVDEHFRFNLGLLYTFAGRNVEKLIRLNLGLSFEF